MWFNENRDYWRRFHWFTICLLFERKISCLFICTTKEQLELIQSKGLFLKQHELEKQKFIEVKLYSEWSGFEDLTINCCKTISFKSI